MVLIVGLGNPGEKFKNTRHNVGFMAVDFFAKKNNFPEFELSKKYHSLISEKIVKEISPNFNGRENKENKIILVKPQTFMNESGKAVKKLISNALARRTFASSKFQISNLVVIHDDMDLPLGKLKIVKERGSAGHHGVESIIESVGNKNLIRCRFGIQPHNGKPKNPESFIIKNFTKEEQIILNSAIEKTTEALEFFIENGLEKTMNEYNR